ncbi:MAG: hypothetical protein JSU70_00990 [Phycisphaerales bacterium]|nr:MAG: hypothetical protein JSU70_00990 [Phycisphaerales bacterium]
MERDVPLPSYLSLPVSDFGFESVGIDGMKLVRIHTLDAILPGAGLFGWLRRRRTS